MLKKIQEGGIIKQIYQGKRLRQALPERFEAAVLGATAFLHIMYIFYSQITHIYLL